MMTPTLSTVEPLVKEHSEYSTFTLSDCKRMDSQDHGNTVLPLKEDNLSNSKIKPKLAGPKVSVI